MHTIINALSTVSRSRTADSAATAAYRQPSYDCRAHPDALKLVVYVPGVDAAGVDIEARGPDLFITARKTHFVRVNWTALHLEQAQRDYQLRLRVGTGFDFAGMRGEIHEGVLTVTLPRLMEAEAEAPGPSLLRVA